MQAVSFEVLGEFVGSFVRSGSECYEGLNEGQSFWGGCEVL